MAGYEWIMLTFRGDEVEPLLAADEFRCQRMTYEEAMEVLDFPMFRATTNLLINVLDVSRMEWH